jgi:MFS family permease
MTDGATSDLPGPGRLALTMFALFMGMFTSNLDSTILATAIPYIINEFHSIDGIGWYGSATFLTFAAFQATWGKVFKYFPLKSFYLLSLFIFEVGSLICALAPNSATLIVGRAIAGIGVQVSVRVPLLSLDILSPQSANLHSWVLWEQPMRWHPLSGHWW